VFCECPKPGELLVTRCDLLRGLHQTKLLLEQEEFVDGEETNVLNPVIKDMLLSRD